MQTVALIDYGSGNLRSAEKALREAARRHAIDADIVVTADPAIVALGKARTMTADTL